MKNICVSLLVLLVVALGIYMIYTIIYCSLSFRLIFLLYYYYKNQQCDQKNDFFLHFSHILLVNFLMKTKKIKNSKVILRLFFPSCLKTYLFLIGIIFFIYLSDIRKSLTFEEIS